MVTHIIIVGCHYSLPLLSYSVLFLMPSPFALSALYVLPQMHMSWNMAVALIAAHWVLLLDVVSVLQVD